jgi:hypothetical protein
MLINNNDGKLGKEPKQASFFEQQQLQKLESA